MVKHDIDDLLDLVRDAELATEADEERVLRATRAALAHGAYLRAEAGQGQGEDGALDSAPSPGSGAEGGSVLKAGSPFASQAGSAGAGMSGGLVTKLGVVALLGAGIGVGLVFLRSEPQPSRRPAAASRPLDASSGAAPQPEVVAPERATPAPRTSAPPTAPASDDPNLDAQKGHAVRRRAQTRTPETPRDPRPGAVARELTLLREVQQALKRGDGAAALRLLDRHPPRDPRFVAEREAARILALCALGNARGAREVAEAFRAAHPRSVHWPAIERSCANPSQK